MNLLSTWKRIVLSPLRLRLSWRLALTLTAILFLATLAQTLLYMKTREETVQEAEASYQTLAKAIEVAAMQIGPEGWKDPRVLAEYRDKLRASGVRDIQVTEAGKPFSEKLPMISPGSRKKAKQPEAIKDILITGVVGEGGSGSVLRIPLVVEGRFLGWVQISYSLENIRELVAENFRRRIYALLGVFALGLAMIVLVARDVTYPIEKVSEAANKVAEGDLDVQVQADREDEIGILARSFNQMTGKLRERQELETRLLRAERQAAMGQLASGLAHEIKNPLNSLALGLDVLRRKHTPGDKGASEEYKSRIHAMKSEVERLASLINSFLSFGRPLNLNRCRLDVTGIVREVVADLTEISERGGVSIRVEDSSEGLVMDGDGLLLKSAVWNLVQNAVQAMEDGGGVVLVRLSPGGSGGQSSDLLIEVFDQGAGIEAKDLPRLFEPYFSRKEGGIGLGLAMTRRIVEEHGGRVTAENRDGSPGAVFSIRLPARRHTPTSANLEV